MLLGINLGVAAASGGGGLPSLPELSPVSNWDGTEASGFSILPSDPTRTTAKPACRLIVPPRQWFTDTLLVGVDAWANNNGSMLNCGLEKVVFHYEGNTADVSSPRFQTFNDANGVARIYFGWWVTLKKPAGVAGYANLYVEAVPADSTMQNRVIGPYLFAPQTQQHDIELEVAATPAEIPGVRYKNPGAALAYLKTQSPNNPRIQITEAGLYEMLESAGASFTDMKGRVLIEATVSGVSIGRAEFTTDDDAKIKNNSFPLHFRGENLTLNLERVVEIDGEGEEGNGLHWLDGVTITSTSPQGRFEQLRGGKIDYFGWRCRYAWMTECDISNVVGSLGQASLARGCTLDAVAYDIASGAVWVTGCSVTDHSDSWWLEDHKAASVTYTGSEATATLERDNGADLNGTIFTAIWGANTATLQVGKDEDDYYNGGLGGIADGFGYDVQDLVDWLNTLDGWSASVSTPDDTSVFASLANQRANRVSTFGKASRSFDAQNVKDVTLQLYIGYDRHSDYRQHISGLQENVGFTNNYGEGQFQALFEAGNRINSQDQDGELRDAIFVNNTFFIPTQTFQYLSSDFLSSQWGKRDWKGKHVVWAHNSWANQGIIVRRSSLDMDIDAYSMLSNNVARGIRFADDVEDADLRISANHTYDGDTPPSIAIGATDGGTVATLFADALNGDFSPSGALLTNKAAPIIEYDQNGTGRATTDAKGAIAA